MKITKSQLKKLIKEELGRMFEEDMGLEGETFNFQILRTDGGGEPVAILKNVPYSMLDARSIERMKDNKREGYKNVERFLKPNKDALEKLSDYIEYVPSVHRAYHLPDSGVGSREPVILDRAVVVDAQG